MAWLACASFVLPLLGTVFLSMRYADCTSRSRKILWIAGVVMQVLAWALYIVLPFTIPVIIFNIVLVGLGSALAGEPFYKTVSQELFPTMLRGSAQGITFGVGRTFLGVWSSFVPALAGAGIRLVATVLTAFLLISGVVRIFIPDTASKPLEQIKAERAAA